MPQQPYILDTAPAKGSFTVTPTDGAGLQWPYPIRGLYVGGAGNIAFIGLDGVTSDIQGAVAGAQYDIAMLRVLSTGTTATLLRGLI